MTHSPLRYATICRRKMSYLFGQTNRRVVVQALAGLKQLQELRLQCNDIAAERNPFAASVHVLRDLTHLRKLTLFTRLDAASTEVLAQFLSDHSASKRLVKIKLSTGLISGSNGADILQAVANHPGLQKLTIVRPDGMGEPLRKAQCTLIGQSVFQNKNIVALHLRRCGMWTDTLSALVPPGPCFHVKRLKLDGNSLGYLSGMFRMSVGEVEENWQARGSFAGSYFNEAMDSLLSRMPHLHALHLGNNQLDARQAEGLAATFLRHKMNCLENLTLGSNDIGDTGLSAILKALPPCMKQLYLHGIDCTDTGVMHLREAVEKWPELWGLGKHRDLQHV
jgi:Ran GTPase-activating protein (RanGAP) involved in mRNA processing and transport